MKCDGKTVYPSKGVAQKAALKASRESGDLITAYYCARHQGHHIGHPLRGLSYR